MCHDVMCGYFSRLNIKLCLKIPKSWKKMPKISILLMEPVRREPPGLRMHIFPAALCCLGHLIAVQSGDPASLALRDCRLLLLHVLRRPLLQCEEVGWVIERASLANSVRTPLDLKSSITMRDDAVSSAISQTQSSCRVLDPSLNMLFEVVVYSR